MALEPVNLRDQVVRTSLADVARERIMQDIIQLRLHPGDIVQLKDLAQAYGMSRTPIREALAQMQEAGLITSIPYRGYRIRPLDKGDIEDVIFMRALLEPPAAERAAIRMSPEAIAELEALRPPQTDTLDLEFDRYSERFHNLIGQASGSRRLAEMIAMVYRDLARLQYAGLSRSVPHVIAHAHDQIIDAIKRRDSTAARDLMSQHVLVVHAKALDEVRQSHATESEDDAPPPRSGRAT